MKRSRGPKLPFALVPALAVALVAAACTGSKGPAPAPTLPVTDPVPGPIVRVGSFDFPESVLLAQIYGRALAAAGYRVSLEPNVGSREIVEPALQEGLVDLVPEYLGSALEFLSLGKLTATSNVEIARLDLAETLRGRGVQALASAPAQDQNGVVVRAETAQTYHLSTISDLAQVAPRLIFGGPPECADRPLCLKGLEQTYRLDFRRTLAFDADGHYTVAALAAGDIDVALLFTTDGRISREGFTLLEDDRGLQPAENVTPLVRAATLRALGDRFTGVVDTVSKLLTTDDLTALNERVSVEGESTTSVALGWLKEHGLGD